MFLLPRISQNLNCNKKSHGLLESVLVFNATGHVVHRNRFVIFGRVQSIHKIILILIARLKNNVPNINFIRNLLILHVWTWMIKRSVVPRINTKYLVFVYIYLTRRTNFLVIKNMLPFVTRKKRKTIALLLIFSRSSCTTFLMCFILNLNSHVIAVRNNNRYAHV